MAARNNTAPVRGRHAKGAAVAYGSRTDVGLVRDHNEDSLIVAPPLFAVADGMGGHAAGEVASEVAVQELIARAPQGPDGDNLARAVVAANRAVIRAAAEGLGRRGMGTTVTAAMLEGSRLVIAQVGDSRAYLLAKGGLQQITRDHSLMADLIESGQITAEEAKTHPQRSVITRALGSDPATLPDIYEMTVEEGDRLLLCSDGLSGMVDDELLESTLSRVGNPQKCADALVDAALAAGGHDNVTAIVVDVAAGGEKRRAKERRRSRFGAVAAIAALLAVLAGAVAAGAAYLNTAAYLAIDDGKLAIYTGIPGEFMGIPTSRFERTCDVDLDGLDLPPATRERLEGEGVRVDSVDDALALVETWKKQGASAQDEHDAAGRGTGSARDAGADQGADSDADAGARTRDGMPEDEAASDDAGEGGDAA